MSEVREYDPNKILVTIGGSPIGGFPDDNFISIERETALYTKVTGADGYTTRIKSNNRSGSVTLTLMQNSPSNYVLEGYVAADDASKNGTFSFMIKDLNTSSVVFSATGWVARYPTIAYGNDMGTREWGIDLADINLSGNGN